MLGGSWHLLGLHGTDPQQSGLCSPGLGVWFCVGSGREILKPGAGFASELGRRVQSIQASVSCRHVGLCGSSTLDHLAGFHEAAAERHLLLQRDVSPSVSAFALECACEALGAELTSSSVLCPPFLGSRVGCLLLDARNLP